MVHARRERSVPETRRHRRMREQASLPAQREKGEIRVALEARRVIRVEVRERDALDPIEIEPLDRLAKHLPDRVRAVDEDPAPFVLEREARRVPTRAERITDPERHEREAHDDTSLKRARTRSAI